MKCLVVGTLEAPGIGGCSSVGIFGVVALTDGIIREVSRDSLVQEFTLCEPCAAGLIAKAAFRPEACEFSVVDEGTLTQVCDDLLGNVVGELSAQVGEDLTFGPRSAREVADG